MLEGYIVSCPAYSTVTLTPSNLHLPYGCPLWVPTVGGPRLHATHDTPPNRPPRRDREPNPLLGQACDNAGTEPVYSFDAGSPHPNRTISLRK